ncbi:MAG: YebC/PmpR family DNA-binding transcriptional regulator [Microgenomates group bacterium]
MSGHSHWATIKRQKEAADKQRGQIFSKLARMITVAAKEGTDPETNFKLRLAIEKAKQANMPKENILRAIERGGGGKQGGDWQEIIFEGYGPEGIGVMVEVVTDNKNRTTAEIKNLFENAGGSLASPGAVSFMFKKEGLITVEKGENPEEQILNIMDLGVNEVEEVKDVIEVYTSPENLEEIKEKLLQAGYKVKDREIIWQPITPVPINDQDKAKKILNFMERLQNHDDVQKVYANFDISNEILSSLMN